MTCLSTPLSLVETLVIKLVYSILLLLMFVGVSVLSEFLRKRILLSARMITLTSQSVVSLVYTCRLDPSLLLEVFIIEGGLGFIHVVLHESLAVVKFSKELVHR